MLGGLLKLPRKLFLEAHNCNYVCHEIQLNTESFGGNRTIIRKVLVITINRHRKAANHTQTLIIKEKV